MTPNDAPAETFSGRALSRLLGVVAGVTVIEARSLAGLAETLLHHPSPAPGAPRGESDLNSNGSPLQALFSARKDSWVVRLIADPAFDRRDPLERLSASREALAATLAVSGAEALGPLAATMLETILPSDEEALRRYPTGVLRLGVALGAPGAAVYAGADPGGSPWSSARRWAQATFDAPGEVAGVIEALARGCSLLGTGIEGASPGHARAKIYWRLASETSLRSFGIPLFESPDVRRFLAAILGEREVPLGALNFSAGFAVSTGKLCDIKVDVARSDLGPADALQLVNEQARLFSLSPPPLHGLFDRMTEQRVGAACVGLGLDVRGGRRINTYLYQR